MKNILEEEFNKYNWGEGFNILVKSELFCDVVFSNCIFRFYLNKMYSSIECKIFEKNNFNEPYTLEDALKYNNCEYPELYWNHSNVEIEEYINQFVNLLYTKLINLIKGDFKWTEKAKIIQLNTKRIQETFGTILVFETEAYKKMIEGDKDWENYLNPRFR